MEERPHQSALRRGRVSIEDMWYSVTSCIDRKRSLLIPDATQLSLNVEGRSEIANSEIANSEIANSEIANSEIANRSWLLPVSDFFAVERRLLPAQIIIGAIRWLHEQKRWICKGYVIMPDHVHIIFILGKDQGLSNVMSSFGKFTARRLNKLIGSKGRIWQHGFYDHCLRDEDAYLRHLRYIYENPVRKGLVGSPEDWPFSAIEPNW